MPERLFSARCGAGASDLLSVRLLDRKDPGADRVLGWPFSGLGKKRFRVAPPMGLKSRGTLAGQTEAIIIQDSREGP
jgi:hypothetical protein